MKIPPTVPAASQPNRNNNSSYTFFLRQPPAGAGKRQEVNWLIIILTSSQWDCMVHFALIHFSQTQETVGQLNRGLWFVLCASKQSPFNPSLIHKDFNSRPFHSPSFLLSATPLPSIFLIPLLLFASSQVWGLVGPGLTLVALQTKFHHYRPFLPTTGYFTVHSHHPP